MEEKRPAANAGSEETPASEIPRGKSGKKLALLNSAYLLLLFCIAAGNTLGAERGWLSALNLYLPQWIWTVPGLGLWWATRARARRQLWLPTLSLAYAAGPGMGLHLPVRPRPPLASGEKLRVMSYNVAQNEREPALLGVIARVNPDLLLLQEAGTLPRAIAEAFPEFHISGTGSCIIASRFPITEAHSGAFPALQYGSGYTRCRLQVGAHGLTVYNLHLETARAGISQLLRRGLYGIPGFEASNNLRVENAHRVAELLRAEAGPLLVGGDFNAPQASLVYRTIRGHRLADFFDAVGVGYGYTYGHALPPGQSFIRIDHLLGTPELQVERCWADTNAASDHQPLVADIVVRPSPTVTTYREPSVTSAAP